MWRNFSIVFRPGNPKLSRAAPLPIQDGPLAAPRAAVHRFRGRVERGVGVILGGKVGMSQNIRSNVETADTPFPSPLWGCSGISHPGYRRRYDISDTNIGNLGTPLEKAIKEVRHTAHRSRPPGLCFFSFPFLSHTASHSPSRTTPRGHRPLPGTSRHGRRCRRPSRGSTCGGSRSSSLCRGPRRTTANSSTAIRESSYDS